MYKILAVGFVMTLVLNLGGTLTPIWPLAFLAAMILLALVEVAKYMLADAACRTIGITLAEFRRMNAEGQTIALETIKHKQQVNELKRKVRNTYH